jgi:type II secretory pathway component PulJ
MILDSRKSYPAFTLWEVIIAMLITSVVVTLSYGAYRQFTGMLEQDSRQMDELLLLSNLEKEIHWLVSASERMEVFDDEIFLFGDQGEASLVFEDGIMDVFLDGESVSQVTVQDWSVEYLDDHSDLIRSFRIICNMGSGSLTLSFRKTYMKKFLYSTS